jgi:hypothetical protein
LSGLLSARDLAVEWTRTESWRRAEDAEQLIAQVDAFMEQRGLASSSISRIQVAQEILRLRTQAERPQPVQTPEEAAWDYDQSAGFGDGDQAMRRASEAALLNHLKNVSMADWATERVKLGVAPKSQFDHLAGLAS